jgi:hypothetical protein
LVTTCRRWSSCSAKAAAKNATSASRGSSGPIVGAPAMWRVKLASSVKQPATSLASRTSLAAA